MAVQIKITFTDGGNLGEDRVLDLSSPRILGRSEHRADVVVSKQDADVSREHLRFQAEGGGAAVVCLSDSGFLHNGQDVRKGEKRPLRRGDELKLGRRVRIRVDRIGSAIEPAERPEDVTVATQATTAETFATQATNAAAFATQATVATSFDSQATVATAFASRATVATSLTKAEAPTGGAPRTAAVEDPPSVTGPSDAGQTVAGPGTLPGNSQLIDAWKEEQERKKRFVKRLRMAAAFGVLAVFGVLVYCFWPRSERWLQHPQPIAQHFVKTSAGTPRIFVDYPKNSATRTGARANGGLDVETLTGLAKDVPFRLSFDITRAPGELGLSLEESSARAIAALAKQGYAFKPAGTEGGFTFFERVYPKSCEDGGTQQGVRLCRREFSRSDGSGQWHGILIFFRDGDTAYRLLREIPETEWPRGVKLLNEDPNLALYAGFLQDQWESPGAKVLERYVGRPTGDLLKEIDGALKRNLPSEWKETERKIDALILAGLRGDANALSEARARRNGLRKAKDLFYDECRARRDMGDADAVEKAWGAFGNDRTDLRRLRLYDSDEWRRE